MAVDFDEDVAIAKAQRQYVNDLDSALETGLTLPSSYYTDSTMFEVEQQRIFRQTWQYVIHEDRLAKPGDHIARRLGDVPIVVVRDRSGDLRAFVNACRHRAHEVALCDGSRQTLQCIYHGWTYNLDGSLREAPRSEREPEFDKSKFGLLPVAVDTWGPLIFVNPSPEAAPLAETLGDFPNVVQARGLDFEPFIFQSEKKYEFGCNWKVLVDNTLECYHCPTAHPSFAEMYPVGPDDYQLEIHGKCSSQFCPPKVEDPLWKDFRLYYIWPNTFLLDAELTYNVIRVDPIDAHTSELVFEFYFLPQVDDEAAEEYVNFYDPILLEDLALCESVQRGHRSGLASPGPLFLDSEILVQHVQKLIRESVGAEDLENA